ncbi:MAG: metallophosphoesterase family protein [Chloroflexi bacterium]|nr:metallophosphoesterase family protein [Ardenticatenaceae bacterium]MBL1127809.1 metallophosphoesterase [Chloroflexota bacterium]NOG33878.1 metallophosphoesterase family protein [Chloroflexota bacterium]GIK54791.1 MAG: metallophosphoesterase [Chloroflexota bacterium]
MRVLIISDIHANFAAFETVLADAAGQWDIIWFLGDLVGYGPDPNECVAELKKHNHISLSGNHDQAVLGNLDIKLFNREANFAISWTQDVLTEESRAYLQVFPSKTVEEPFTLAHASPRYPVWEYIIDPGTAAENFDWFQTPYCFVGHTHVPVIFEERVSSRREIYMRAPFYMESGEPFMLGESRLIINPGSVGQPRDSDPRAAYALLDTEALMCVFRRVEYPVQVTQRRMEKFGMPRRLVERLAHGV